MGEQPPADQLEELTVTFRLMKILSPEQKRWDALGRSPFERKWLPLSSFLRPDGSVKTTVLLKSYFRIQRPAFDSFFGGFFFRSGGKPWGFSLDDDSMALTLDYVSYASHWFRAALETCDKDHVHRFTIYGRGLSLSRRGEIGTIADEGVQGRMPPKYQPIHFEYRSFFRQIREQSALYQAVYQDLMRRVAWAAQDPQRAEHVEAIRTYLPSFEELHQQLEAAELSPPDQDSHRLP